MIYTVTLNPALDRELIVPAILVDEVLRATQSRVDCGGKGFNVSRTLAMLGVPSTALALAGGQAGATLRAALLDLGVTAEFVAISGETRSNVSIISQDYDHTIKVNEPGPLISADEQAALMTLVRERARPGDWWILAGSLPPGVSATIYADLISVIKAAGGQTILDTSGVPLRHGCAARPMLVKPNALEASQLTRRPVNSAAEAVEAARQLEGIEYVIISLGQQGAVLVQGEQAWLASPPHIEARNTIGAGDALVAGLVWGLSQHDALLGLRWGVACGASAASQLGTTIGTHAEVARLAARVELHSLPLD